MKIHTLGTHERAEKGTSENTPPRACRGTAAGCRRNGEEERNRRAGGIAFAGRAQRPAPGAPRPTPGAGSPRPPALPAAMSWAVRAGCGVRHQGGAQTHRKHGLAPHCMSRGSQVRLGGPPPIPRHGNGPWSSRLGGGHRVFPSSGGIDLACRVEVHQKNPKTDN